MPGVRRRAGDSRAVDASRHEGRRARRGHTRKIAPILRPSRALAERIVSVSRTIAHTPRALAM